MRPAQSDDQRHACKAWYTATGNERIFHGAEPEIPPPPSEFPEWTPAEVPVEPEEPIPGAIPEIPASPEELPPPPEPEIT
ncbi:MAG: hypothetical protein ACXW2A_15920 [Burkholderiales bacterium]